MKVKKNLFKILISLASLLLIGGCNNRADIDSSDYNKKQQIYLYGEIHGQEDLVAREYELWHSYYHQHGMRNLFIELANFEAGLLNLWLETGDDEILRLLAIDYGDVSGANYYKDFLEKIRDECPETVFYGTDISYFSDSLGEAYLGYLEKSDSVNVEEIQRVKQVMEDGNYRNATYEKYLNTDKANHYIRKMADFREEKLVENFIYEFDRLEDKRIMGIYGAYHVSNPQNQDFGDDPIMASRLTEHYGDIIFKEILADNSHFNKRWE